MSLDLVILLFLIDNLETSRLIFLLLTRKMWCCLGFFGKSINAIVMLNTKSDITKSSRVKKCTSAKTMIKLSKTDKNNF